MCSAYRHCYRSLLSVFIIWVTFGGEISSVLSAEHDMENDFAKEFVLHASSLIGKTIVDQSGNDLGTVKNVLIDRKSSQIKYLILSYSEAFGGPLGINESNFSIPWQQVTLHKREDGTVVEVAEVAIQETSIAN